MIFKISEKLDRKKFAIHTLYQILFRKITISQKLKKKIILKNLLVVCTLSFHIRSNFIIIKKNCGPPYAFNDFKLLSKIMLVNNFNKLNPVISKFTKVND